MGNKVSFEEKRKIQLEMLDEIDVFCRTNDIRYSIAFGTLLGAIRHKGFIPWDDDVDIMMPLPDLLKFKELFKSDRMQYVDVDVDRNYALPFSRIANVDTYNKEGIVSKGYGVCIDLYVIVGVANLEEYLASALPLCKKRLKMIKWRNRIIRKLPFSTIPGYTKSMKIYRNYLFENCCEYNNALNYYIIAGPLSLSHKMSYDRDIFSDIIPLKFEGREYLAISDYDYFLTKRYGDYMQLPPEDQRHPYHGGNYYWK